MGAHRSATIAALCALCVACAGPDGDRIQFCEASGQEVGYALFDEATGALWLSDMGLEQLLECGSEALCFSPAEKSFIVSRAVDAEARRRNDFDWGHIEWRLDLATRELVLVLDNQAMKSRHTLRSCKPATVQTS